MDMETQLEREFAAEQEELLEVEEKEDEEDSPRKKRDVDGGVEEEEEEEDDIREHESIMATNGKIPVSRPGLAKVRSLPANFIYNPPRERSGDGTAFSF